MQSTVQYFIKIAEHTEQFLVGSGFPQVVGQECGKLIEPVQPSVVDHVFQFFGGERNLRGLYYAGVVLKGTYEHY